MSASTTTKNATQDVKTTAGRRKAAGVRKAQPPIVKYYLVAYNLLSCLAWGSILLLLLLHIFSPSNSPSLTSSKSSTITSKIWSLFNSAATSSTNKRTVALDRLRGAYSAVGPLTKIVQTFAALEVVHAATGLVRSPWLTTAAQVASRLWTVWGVVEVFHQPQISPAYSLLIFAWSFTEVVRYAYYALNLLNIEPYPLLWLRYSTFYPLYPLGAASELFLSLIVLKPLARLPLVGSYLGDAIRAIVPASYTKGSQGLLALNKGLGRSEHWDGLDYFRGFLVLIWPPALVVMYTYMIGQRKKALRAAKGGKKVGEEKKRN
ncbi:tyrosine phosphatase-like protein [Mrakia frigida]|uniref:enoyl-CoA hydratase PHS1 n=1 Tax=Mrakia frigida TaxID=29902 RepID=UPI003FCBF3C1